MVARGVSAGGRDVAGPDAGLRPEWGPCSRPCSLSWIGLTHREMDAALTDQPKWRKWIWIGAWLLALVLVGGALTRLGVSRSRAAPPQASVAWTPWPTVTAVPTMAEATIAPEASPGPTATPTILGRVMVPRVGIDTAIVAVGWHLEWLQGSRWACGTWPRTMPGGTRVRLGWARPELRAFGDIKGTDEACFARLSDVVAETSGVVVIRRMAGAALRVTERCCCQRPGGPGATPGERRYMDPTADNPA
jgi:hypothetical protein